MSEIAQRSLSRESPAPSQRFTLRTATRPSAVSIALGVLLVGALAERSLLQDVFAILAMPPSSFVSQKELMIESDVLIVGSGRRAPPPR